MNTKIRIMTCFKIRMIFQNIPNYITIFVGIFFAGFILVFGNMFSPLLDNVADKTIENIPASYQYILKVPAETETANAEKYCIGTLKTSNDSLTENITIYGISDNSKYINANFSDKKFYISSAYSDKYGLEVGDTITLTEEFKDKEYTFHVDDIYENPTTLAIFMSQEYFNEAFEYDTDYYSGYLSNQEITDIDDSLIATVITESDYTKSTRQLKQSMGNMMIVFGILGVAVFMLIIYLLAKIIIEKNSQSISIAKILGYNKSEINRIYIHTISIVTIISLFVVMPIIHVLMNLVWHMMMKEYTGWLPYDVDWSIYFKIVVIGIVTYAAVAALLMRRTNKVPMSDALKNVE